MATRSPCRQFYTWNTAVDSSPSHVCVCLTLFLLYCLNLSTWRTCICRSNTSCNGSNPRLIHRLRRSGPRKRRNRDCKTTEPRGTESWYAPDRCSCRQAYSSYVERSHPHISGNFIPFQKAPTSSHWTQCCVNLTDVLNMWCFFLCCRVENWSGAPRDWIIGGLLQFWAKLLPCVKRIEYSPKKN